MVSLLIAILSSAAGLLVRGIMLRSTCHIYNLRKISRFRRCHLICKEGACGQYQDMVQAQM